MNINISDKNMLSAVAVVTMNAGKKLIKVRNNINEQGELFSLDVEKIKIVGAILCSKGLPVIDSLGRESLLKFKGEPFLIEFVSVAQK